MNKKNVATTIILLLCSVWFAITGSTFINFLYTKNKIVVEDPVVTVSSSVLVYNYKDESKTQIAKIEFNDMDLGLKPVTGQPDKNTNIPTTVTNKNGTEGLYSTIKITAPANLTIQVTNIKIESDQNVEDVNLERKNMWIALKDVENSAKTLENNTVVIANLQNEQKDAEYTILFWLDAKVGEVLKGAKITFEMQFIV